MSYLDASSVDVLVEAALRVARIERRRVALQDLEAVGGVRRAGTTARYGAPGVGPGHVDAAGHGRDVDVVAPEADHSSAMRFPVVVAGEVADPRLGPAGAAIARLGDEGIDRPTRVPAVRRISGWPVRGVARVVSRVVEDDGDHTVRGRDVGKVLVAGTHRIEGGGRRPVGSIGRVAHENLGLAAGQLAVPDHMDTAGVGGHCREARKPGIGEPTGAGRCSVAAVTEAVAAELVGIKGLKLRDDLRLAEGLPAIGRPLDRDGVARRLLVREVAIGEVDRAVRTNREVSERFLAQARRDPNRRGGPRALIPRAGEEYG